ncbi:MAG: hypothetical protein O3C10_09725 [Chloroflexi bacterium]|nr:hypothetical protein [Chloroflexota bacterium]
MTDPATEAIEAFNRWHAAFDTRDTGTQLSLMHFPHVRQAGNRFQTWETANEFGADEKALTDRLKAEGWDHTVTLSINATQADDTKVHLGIGQSRRDADDAEYNRFDTPWIFTNIDGK